MLSKDSWCVWVTGLPGSGKSVVAQAPYKILQEHNIHAQILSSDALRKAITPESAYAEEGRDMFYGALVLLAKHLKCPLEVCIERESKRGRTFQAPKDIYKRALKGEAPTVPGIGAPYEEPLHPEVAVDSDKLSPEECAQKIYEAITKAFRSF